jgi:excisionase family DNA binding protein
MFEERINALNGISDEAIPDHSCAKRVYTVEDIQEILGVSKTTAYNLASSGEFRCIKVGGQYRVSKKSFDLWLEGNQ